MPRRVGAIGRHQKNVLLAGDPLTAMRLIGVAVKAPAKRRSAKAGFASKTPLHPPFKRSAIFQALRRVF